MTTISQPNGTQPRTNMRTNSSGTRTQRTQTTTSPTTISSEHKMKQRKRGKQPMHPQLQVKSAGKQ
eukprot:10695343-Ditylum_brightwellii.AAC.1